jgi:hypothetical protein
MADSLLRHLHLDVLDLLEQHELDRHGPLRLVPVLRQGVGPGHPFAFDTGEKSYPFPGDAITEVEDPVAARVDGDAALPAVLRAGDWVLLDRGGLARRDPDGGLYCVEIEGAVVIRRVLRKGGHLRVDSHGSISLTDRDILDVVKAKVVWFGRQLERTSLD